MIFRFNLSNLLASLWLAAVCLGAPPVHAAKFDLSTATIAEINAAFDSGALTSEKLVGLYLARIEAYDKAGPKINAVTELNKEALAQARALDAERKAKGPRSPMHGIPFVVKDLFDVAGMTTTGGFKPFSAVPTRHANAVQRAIDAGAIMLAKVSTTNWWGRGFDANHVIGPTLNPYNIAYDCSGSSNGTAAAMAAWFATVGLGTDTGQSVQDPSAVVGVVGMVNSFGMISRAGVVPRGAAQDRVGPMGRNVQDVATFLSVVAGWDAEDLSTFSSMGHFPDGDWSGQLKQKSMAGLRIGVLREMIHTGPAHQEGIDIFEKSIAAMRQAGAFVVDPVLTGIDLKKATQSSQARTAEYEKIHFQNAYLARLGAAAPFKTIQEMHAKVGADKFAPNFAAAFEYPSPDESADYLARYRARQMIQQLIGETIAKFNLDCLVIPYRTIPALPWENRPQRPEINNNLTSNASLPALIYPCGYTGENLPISLQFIGAMHSDLKLLQIGYAYEQAVQGRKTPPTTPALPGEVFEY